MSDDQLNRLLKRADERFQNQRAAAAPDFVGATGCAVADFVEIVRSRRARRVTQRNRLGVFAILLIIGLSAWSLSGDWRRRGPAADAIAKRTTAVDHAHAPSLQSVDELARLKAEIAALDAEANRAMRFVELYQAAEARRNQLAQVEAENAAPMLPPAATAELEIDRAAEIAVITADSQARQFNRYNDAADGYRSVLEHFPESRWAAVARTRLDQMQSMN